MIRQARRPGWRPRSTDGYPAFLVTQRAADFTGYGMGSYNFFNQGVPIFATNGFEADNPPGLALHDLLTIFLTAQAWRRGSTGW